MGGVAAGLPTLVVWITPVVHSVAQAVGVGQAVSDRPLVSVIATAELATLLYLVRMLFTGRLMTGREADERDKRYAEKVEECKELRTTLAGMVDGLETVNTAFRTLIEESHRQDTRSP